jgi:hypothetical protein
MPIPTTLTTARSTLATKRAATAQALFDFVTAQANLDAAVRSGDPGAISGAQSGFNAAFTNLGNARGAEQTARGDLNSQISSWLAVPGSSNPTQFITPDADFARMDRTDCPVAFIPLRLETKFDVPNAVLHIRIYPDEFFSDIHERQLTPDEFDAGFNFYWQGISAPGPQERVDRWAVLAKRYGVPRAAYIVNATQPDSTFPGSRATVPSRAAEAVLPDRWVALAYKGGALRHTQVGLPIPEPIDLTANPSADDQQMVEVANGFKVPSNILWTMQYGDALNKGMAIDITGLASDELQTGFDRLVVLGIKTSMDPGTSAGVIDDLLFAHHYTRGLDLVAQGTPTNNVPGQPTPFTMKDPPAAESFQFERFGSSTDTGDLNKPLLDADILNLALGSFPFINTRGATNNQQDNINGRNMRQVLWPATLGYFLRQMMNPPVYLNGGSGANFNEQTVANAQDFFINWAAPEGPIPAFRVGAVPYGVLPAISLSRMVAQGGENSTAIDVMRSLLPYWQTAAATVPTVPANSNDRNTDLMRVLSQKSSSDSVFVRNSIGPDTITNLLQWIFHDVGAFYSALAQLAATDLGTLKHTEWSGARIFQLTFLNAVARYAGPLVTAHPSQGLLVSAVANPKTTTDALNYLAYLGNTALTQSVVQGPGSMLNVAPGNEQLPLLWLLARHSFLLNVVDVARTRFPSLFEPKFIDLEFWGITVNQDPVNGVFTLLASTAAPNNQHTPFDQIRKNIDANGNPLSGDSPLKPISDALNGLSTQPVADLERVFTENLDLAAHRLDAFVTGLATRRFIGFRKGEFQGEHSPTTYLGGYGIVENVVPATQTTRQVNGTTVNVQLDNGGYVHAPSLRHATTAAILRSGRMAEKSDPTKYAIELPSDRARRARLLVDGIRDGLPLGELLGFQLESELRAGTAPQPEAIILALRQLYPLVANKSGLDPGQPADGIAAANVVDGQLVRQAAAGNTIPFGTNAVLANGKTAILTAVKDLNDTVDAIGDLEMSEAVYQVAAGDVASAEAAMNFLPDGSNPPQSEVTTSPSAGIPVSHRVAVLIEEQPALPPSPWSLGKSPRGQVDAFAEAWVGSLLDPTHATATASFQLNGQPHSGSVSVAQMPNIGPLDFLALAQSTSVSGQGSPLDRHLVAAFQQQFPGATGITLTGYDSPSRGPSIPQLIEIARALGAVLGGARELAAADLVLTPDDVPAGSLTTLAGTLQTQVSNALVALQNVVSDLSNIDARTALTEASAYQAEAFPDPSGDNSDLPVLLMSAKGELGRRVTDAQAAAPGTSPSDADAIAAYINQLRIIFGRNTLVVLPAAVPPGSGELGQSLTALDQPLDLTDQTLDFTNPDTFAPHQAPGRYLQQASRMHERLAAWRRFNLYAGAQGGFSPRVSVAQLPFVAGESWVGRVAPTDSRTSLLFISASGQTALPDPSKNWRGLLLDQWTELVPASTVETGLAFHYDSQNSEAPQVILMGMHSGQTGGWTLTELQAIVNETMDLALIRPVDSELVGLGQLVPAICLAANKENQVVCSNIGPGSVENVPIVVG